MYPHVHVAQQFVVIFSFYLIFMGESYYMFLRLVYFVVHVALNPVLFFSLKRLYKWMITSSSASLAKKYPLPETGEHGILTAERKR